MRKYEMFELEFQGEEPKGSQVKVDLKAVFTWNGTEMQVKGFYAGNRTYKVRFLPQQTGVYTWKVLTEFPLIGPLEGKAECQEAVPGRHGLVRADGLHFKYEDDTRYLPFGTTVYALVHQEKALIDQTMETLKTAPFNKIRFCVFPKHYDFNHNEPEYFAFEKKGESWDYNHPCFAFWDALEDRMRELLELGIEADLILFHGYDRWGFSLMSGEECMTYLDYAVRRLSAFPNLWWSMANEYEVLVRFETQRWYDIAAFIHENDPYGHLLSNHNFLKFWDFQDAAITHCSIQDSNVVRVPELQKKYHKPVVFDECCYEGNIRHPWGNLSGFELVNRFWIACTMGGYCTHGETFMSPDEILWWARGGVLHGESPARIAFLREIVEELPGNLEYIENPIEQFCDDGILPENADPDTERLLRTIRTVMGSVSEVRSQGHFDKERVMAGHCGEEAYLRYFARQCASEGELKLPEYGSYDIEVIDVWKMTRQTVLEGVHGTVNVPMPGIEGIAILAKRRESV